MSFDIKYFIEFQDGHIKEYLISLDNETSLLIAQKHDDRPDWTKLDSNKCENCTLNSDETPYCPVAENTWHMIDDFKDVESIEQVKVRVETENREYRKETDIQYVLRSLFGVIMATSGCPNLDHFRVMARFHLPFASVEEHLLRSTAFHLLDELFRHGRGESADFDLTRLKEQYEKVNVMNFGFAERMSEATNEEANSNAIVGLHTISELITAELDTDISMLEMHFR